MSKWTVKEVQKHCDLLISPFEQPEKPKPSLREAMGKIQLPEK